MFMPSKSISVFKIYFNIILFPSVPRCSKCSLSFKVHQNSVWPFPAHPYVSHALSISDLITLIIFDGEYKL
jgi:hypothetical protein